MRGLASILTLLAMGCGDRAELLVQISTDLLIPADADKLSVQVTSRGQTVFQKDYLLPSEAALPATLDVAPRGNAPTTVEIVARLLKAGVTVVERLAIVTIEPNSQRQLSLALDRVCATLAQPCATGLTCIGGACRDPKVPFGELPGIGSSPDLSSTPDLAGCPPRMAPTVTANCRLFEFTSGAVPAGLGESQHGAELSFACGMRRIRYTGGIDRDLYWQVVDAYTLEDTVRHSGSYRVSARFHGLLDQDAQLTGVIAHSATPDMGTLETYLFYLVHYYGAGGGAINQFYSFTFPGANLSTMFLPRTSTATHQLTISRNDSSGLYSLSSLAGTSEVVQKGDVSATLSGPQTLGFAVGTASENGGKAPDMDIYLEWLMFCDD